MFLKVTKAIKFIKFISQSASVVEVMGYPTCKGEQIWVWSCIIESLCRPKFGFDEHPSQRCSCCLDSVHGQRHSVSIQLDSVFSWRWDTSLSLELGATLQWNGGDWSLTQYIMEIIILIILSRFVFRFYFPPLFCCCKNKWWKIKTKSKSILNLWYCLTVLLVFQWTPSSSNVQASVTEWVSDSVIDFEWLLE